jgi:hypothetical protein
MISIGKQRDEIPEHVRRGREAVQQKNGRRPWISGFPVKDLDAGDLNRAIVDLTG